MPGAPPTSDTGKRHAGAPAWFAVIVFAPLAGMILACIGMAIRDALT